MNYKNRGVKSISILVALSFLFTNSAYPQIQGFNKGEASNSTLRAVSFKESEFGKTGNPGNPFSPASPGEQTPVLGGDNFPVMMPGPGEKELAAWLEPKFGSRAAEIARGILAKGIEPRKRGAGKTVATGAIRLKRQDDRITGSLSKVKPLTGTAPVADETLQTSNLVALGLKWLLERQDIEVVGACVASARSAQATIPIEFKEDHDRLMNLLPPTGLKAKERRAICFDMDCPARMNSEANRQGLTILYGFGLMHQFYRVAGEPHQDALLKVVSLYEALRPEEQKAVMVVLGQDEIDNADLFRSFLANASGSGKPAYEKRRQAALLVNQELFEPVYARRKVLSRVLDEHGRPRLDELGLTELRKVAHTLTRDTYSNEMEAAIAELVANEVQERGMQLVMGYLGRAGLVEQLLMAAAKQLPIERFRGAAGKIAKEFESSKLELESPELSGVANAWRDAGAAFAEIERILNTVSEDSASEKQLQRAISDFKRAMLQFEYQSKLAVEDLKTAQASVVADEIKRNGESPTHKRLTRDITAVSTVCNKFIDSVFKRLEVAAADAKAEGFRSYVNVAIQRLAEKETANLVLLNELLDPYLGETRAFRELLNEGSDTMHVTANMGPWLERVSHWIQALPAYAWYRITDLPGGDYEIMAGCERDTLEYAFKGNIDGIVNGIERVMRLEHAALARTYLAERMGPDFQREINEVVEERRKLGDDVDKNREEAIRLLLQNKGLGDAVAALAALVDAAYRNLEEEVAGYTKEQMQKGRYVERIAALREVIRRDQSEKNLIKNFLVPLDKPVEEQGADKNGAETKQAADTLIAEHGLDETRRLMSHIALQRRQDQPTYHNLTTLGPGETTTYLRSWLETGISLKLFCRDNGLDARVTERVSDYSAKISHAALRVIKELHMDGELSEYMVANDMDANDETQRLRAAPALMKQYREISHEVARICTLLSHEEKTSGSKVSTDKEPQAVIDYIDANRKTLEDVANLWAVAHEGMLDAVKKIAVEGRMPRGMKRPSLEQVAAWLVDPQNERERKAAPYVDEDTRRQLNIQRDAYMLHLARKTVVREKGLIDGARVYNRLHLPPLALYTAREEVVGEYIAEGKCTEENARALKEQGLKGPFSVLNLAKYRYESVGPHKKFHLTYTPSRVDLGEGERASVESTGKVVSAEDRAGLNAGSRIYDHFSLAGTVQFSGTARAETFKSRENFFTRGGVFYLSLGEGINIDAIGMGDQEENAYWSNLRGDRTVLPGGEGYRGFCVPKEFFLIYAVMMAARNKEAAMRILANFAPADPTARRDFLEIIDKSIMEDEKEGGYRIVVPERESIREDNAFIDRRDFFATLCKSLALPAKDLDEWWEKAQVFFDGEYEKYFDVLGANAFLARLPQLAQALHTWHITRSPEEQESIQLISRVTLWADDALQRLEQMNRMGYYRKPLLMWQALLENRERRIKAGLPVKPLCEVVVVTGSSYKAGTRVDGKDSPITDARLASASGYLHAYAGTDTGVDEQRDEEIEPPEHALIHDFDPEGKRIARKIKETIGSPGDIHFAGTVGKNDVLTGIPGIEVNPLIEQVKGVLMRDFGIPEDEISACCADLNLGARLWKWPAMQRPIRGNLELEKRRLAILRIPDGGSPLKKAEGGRTVYDDGLLLRRLHLLTLEKRDVIRKYRRAIQGADVFNLVIGDPELLDIIDNLPEFLALARIANPDGYTTFVDGPVGARSRLFATRYPSAKFKAQELFALEETAVYRAMGLGDQDIQAWRREMEVEKARAEALFKALVEAKETGDYTEAQEIYNEVTEYVVLNRKANEADLLALQARQSNRGKDVMTCVARGIGKVHRGLPLERLDFATWLVLGGRYLLNGKMDEKGFAEQRKLFEDAIERCPKSGQTFPRDLARLTKAQVTRTQNLLLRPVYKLPFVDSTYASKASETVTVGKVEGDRTEVLAGIAQRQQKVLLQGMLNERRKAFKALCGPDGKVRQQDMELDFEKVHENAKNSVGNPDSAVSQSQFSALVYWTQVACLNVLHTVIPDKAELPRLKQREKMETQIKQHLSGEGIDPEMHRKVVKDLVRLMEIEHQRLIHYGAQPEPANQAIFNVIGKAGELLDMTLLVSLEYDIDLAGAVNEKAAATEALFKYFDKTINAHMFDYFPFLIQPSLSEGVFDSWFTYEEKFEFARRCNTWLYPRLRKIVAERTALSERGPAYCNVWLGDVSDTEHPAKWTMGLGVKTDGPAKEFWYSLAKLRDAVTMMQEFSGLQNPSTMEGVPEIFVDVDPVILGADERGIDENGRKFSNIIVVYPHGNTTMPVAMEHGAVLEKEGYNFILCPFPVKTYDAVYQTEVLQARDALMYVSAARYERLLIASGVSPEDAKKRASRVPEKGILVALKFREPQLVNRGKEGVAYMGAVTGHACFFHFTHEMRPYIDGLKIPLVQPLVKEASDYLKCEIPEMLKGTSVAFPVGFMWKMSSVSAATDEAKRELGDGASPEQIEQHVKKQIRQKLIAFLKDYPTVTEIIEKPEKESGGRGSLALPVLDRENRRKGKMRFYGSENDFDSDMEITDETKMPEGMKNLIEMADAIYEVSRTDNVVVQGLVHSFARTLFTRKFLKKFVAKKGKRGDVVSLDFLPGSPLFSYFRRVGSRGAGGVYAAAMKIGVTSLEPIGNVARGSILDVIESGAIAEEFRGPFMRAMDQVMLQSVTARRAYLRHVWPHVLREYLVLNKRFGREVNRQLGKFLQDNFNDIVTKFFEQNQQFHVRQADFTEFLNKWKEDFLGVDADGRDFSSAIENEFGKMAVPFKEFLGGYLEGGRRLSFDIHYSMDDFMPMYLGDENRNLTYILEKDKDGNLVPDNQGNVKILPLVSANGRPTAVRLYDSADKAARKEIRTRDGARPVPVALFDSNGKELGIYDEHGNRVSCIEGFVIEFNPGAGLWRPYDMALAELDPNRAGEGVLKVFRNLGERADQYNAELRQVIAPVSDGETPITPAAPVHTVYSGAGENLFMRQSPSMPGTLDSFVDEALKKAREDLNKGPGYTLTADDISVVLTHVALESMRWKCDDDWDKVRGLVAGTIGAGSVLAREYTREELADSLTGRLGVKLARGVDLEALLQDDAYMRSLDRIIGECSRLEENAVALRISPEPITADAANILLGNAKNCALVFDGMETIFANMIRAFQLDSDVAAGGAENRLIYFMGVRKEWLTPDGKSTVRALILDDEGMLKEVTFAEPVTLDGAGVYNLEQAAERATHRELSDRFKQAGIRVLNPYSAALGQDSKTTAHDMCDGSDKFIQPAYRLLKLEDVQQAGAVINLLVSYVESVLRGRSMFTPTKKDEPKKIEVVIKPDHGTEGVLSKSFTLSVGIANGQAMLVEDEQLAAAVEHIQEIQSKANDDVAVTEMRGKNVTYKGKRVVFRINAAETARRFVANTGCVRVAASEDQTIVSPQAGATTEDINEVLWNIEWEGKPLRDIIDLNDAILRMRDAAQEAARRLGVRGIAGVDLLLEVNADNDGNPRVDVIFLESNPRPALLGAAKRINMIVDGSRPAESLPEVADPSFYQYLYSIVSGVPAAEPQGAQAAQARKDMLTAI